MSTSVKEMLAAANAVVPKLSPEDARAMIAAGALLVDIRDGTEIQRSGKIAGALAVSRGLLEFKADPESPVFDSNFRKDAPVLLYCGSGGRAALAGKTLRDMGFETVYNAGGFNDLVATGLPVEPA